MRWSELPADCVHGDRLPPLRLLLPADPGAVEQARSAVLRHLEPLQLAPRVVFALELVLEETLMNIATHAYPDRAAQAIELALDVDAEQIVLQFADAGIEFDPLAATPAKLPATIAQAEPGGLGLMLTRRYARHMAYQRREGRNLLTIAIARE
jgi:serine/threonine-protein kinase RsbW